MKKDIVILSLLAAAVACGLSLGAFAGEPTGVFVNGVDVGVKSSGDGWNYDSAHRINIKKKNGHYFITGADKGALGIRVKIEAQCSVSISNLTLKAVDDHCNALWLDASKSSLSSSLYFKGTNTLTGADGAAAIGVKSGQTIEIFGGSLDAVLVVQGGTGGAGIGGDDGNEKAQYSNCGTVKIDGGRIVATGGKSAAGIGGGGNSAYMNGSSGGHGGKVWISDELSQKSSSHPIGSTVVIARGGGVQNGDTANQAGGAGIGGGWWHGTRGGDDGRGGSVIVEGGRVVANGGYKAAGIGGTSGGYLNLFAISGGYVEANAGLGDYGAAAIGNGARAFKGMLFNFLMQGGRVVATVWEEECAGIGGGHCSNGGTISIYGGTVDASSIGGGLCDTNGVGFCDTSSLEGSTSCDSKINIHGGSVNICGRLNTPAEDNRADCQLWVNNTEDYGQIPVRFDGFKSGAALTFTGLNYAFNGGKYGVNDIVADDKGGAWLWLPEGGYCVKITDGTTEKRTAFQIENLTLKALEVPAEYVDVVWDAKGGTVVSYDESGNMEKHGASCSLHVEKYKVYGTLPKLDAVRDGYKMLGWRPNHYVDDETQIAWDDLTFTALWEKIEETENYTGDTGDSGLVPAVKAVTVTFNATGGKIDGEGTITRQATYGGAIGELPTPVRSGCVFTGWYHPELENPILATYKVWGDVTLYAGWKAGATLPVKTVYMHCCQGEGADGTGPVYTYEYEGYGAGSGVYYQSEPPFSELSPTQEFLGWFTQQVGGQAYPAWEEVVNPGDEHYYAQWKQKTTEWMVNRYCCAKLTDLIANSPDLSNVKSVKASGLPKGLKVVQDKAKTAWYVEGVPTETLNGTTSFAVVDFTCKSKGDSIPTQKLLLSVEADEQIREEESIDAIYEISAQDLFSTIIGEKTVDKNWKMAIAPSGVIKYATKDNTKWKDASKTEYVEDALTFYGELTKLGLYIITASAPVTSEVTGTKYTEKYVAEILVTPLGGFDEDHTISVKVNAAMTPVELSSVTAVAVTDSKTKPTGSLPAGIKFTNKALTDKTYGAVPAGSFYGTPTKLGTYVVTLKDKDKNEDDFLIVVKQGASSKMLVGVGSKASALKKKVFRGDQQAEDLGAYELMVGANVDFPISIDEGATVKATGLPTGLKLVQDKTTKDWSITGYPTKKGTFYVTLTATLNKVATAISIVFTVLDNEFAGEYRGYAVSYLRDGQDKFLSPMIVNVAAGGAVSVSLTELGTTAKYSAKSFDWDELNGNAWIEFETKKTKALPFVRTVRLEILDQGGWKAVAGTVSHPESLGVEDGTLQAWPVVSQKALVENGIIDSAETPLPRIWNFTEDVSEGDGVYVPVALATTWLDVKKGTAKVTVKDCEGLKYAIAALPVVRIGDDETDPASYGYAPFGCYDKADEVTHLYILALDGSDAAVSYDCDSSIRGEYIDVDTEEYEYSTVQKSLAELVEDEMSCVAEFQSGTEYFQFVKTADGKKVELYGADGTKLATLSVKLAKEGTASFKFTDKSKVTYEFDVGYFGVGFFRGTVHKSWKDGKLTLNDWAIVEIF